MSRLSDKPASGVLDDVDLYTGIYRQMLLIRGIEDLIQSLFLKGEVYGTTHLYSGQEAIATGVASLLEDRDRVAATYRGHGHALALGVDPQRLLDEMLGRETGINGGRAGSMNVNSLENGLIGSFGIVGGSIAAATGAALALKRTTGGVAVAYFGDGAMNQGYVFECLNFCQVLKLPLVFVCENNGYGEYTAFRSVTAGEIRARAEVMEVPAETIDGMRAWTVRDAAVRAIAHARAGNGPYFIEALTYPSSDTRAAIPARTGRRVSSTSGSFATRSCSSVRSSRPKASRPNVWTGSNRSWRTSSSACASAASLPRSRRSSRPPSSRSEPARADDAQALRLGGGRSHRALAEGAGRLVRTGRRADRSRDRQGHRRLRS